MIRAVALGLLLLGCEADPVSISSSNNPQVPVSLLFEHDGCKVYRFADSGYHRYFVRCPANQAAFHGVKTGKNSYLQESIETETE